MLKDFGDSRAAILDQVSADVDFESLIFHGKGATSQVRAFLANEYRFPLLGQESACRQASSPGSNNNDIVFGHTGNPQKINNNGCILTVFIELTKIR
jgi:hypothetical protein